MTQTAAHYLDEVRRQFRGYKRLAEGAIAQLKDDELFVALDPESNCIAILVKHLAGNMRSRFTDFLTSDGEKPDRQRDQEFELTVGSTRADVMHGWEQGWACVFSALESLNYAYHIGQIVHLAKHLRSKEWKTLSVPRGKSEEFNRMSLEERRRGANGLAKVPTSNQG